MNLDLNQVEEYLKKYGKKIKTIIPVHFAGNPVKMNQLRDLANFHGCFLLEDAAHALESIDDGK
jgi:dTDP-4-amino-4,6-dideoxygalactose transaminase